jgi:RHS repeat-associated protein
MVGVGYTGRLSTVNGQKAGELNKSYAAGFSYTAAGAVSAMQMGNGLVEQAGFNARLQPVQIKLGTVTSPASVVQLDYGYGTTNNNGNVVSQTITAPKTAGGSLVLQQTYGYDSLNRLVSAGENGMAWQQTYDMDRFGNRAVRATSYIPNPQLTPQSASLTDFSAFDQSSNRLSVTKYPQVLYDGAGNLKRDQAGSAFTYDGENRQLTASVGGASASYFYDGDGRRVKKVVGSVTTVFVYNAGGQLVAEYVSDPVPPPAGGGGTSYLTSDHLGSTRVVTKADCTVKARYDYLPFGEELPASISGRSQVNGYGGADSTRQKFTSKERDAESGLDYFLSRYYSSAQGRFTSVDPLDPVLGKQGANDKKKAEEEFREYLEQPQHWNRYPYALNNPLRFVDPDGFIPTIHVAVNIIFDEKSNYDEKQKKEIINRYLKEANGKLAKIGIVLEVISQGNGSFNSEDRTIEKGYNGNALNVVFTTNDKLPSDEVTQADRGVIFIQTHTQSFVTGETQTASDLLLHGSLHAFGIARGQGNYPNTLAGYLFMAEPDVKHMMSALSSSDFSFVGYKSGELNRSAFLMSKPVRAIRNGARRYAMVGPFPK